MTNDIRSDVKVLKGWSNPLIREIGEHLEQLAAENARLRKALQDISERLELGGNPVVSMEIALKALALTETATCKDGSGSS